MPEGGFTSSSVERRRSWTAWQGDLDQFRRLARVFEEQCVQRKAAMAVINEDHNENRAEKNVDDNGDEDKPLVLLAVRERDGEYGGGLETILEQFDRRTALGVEFESNISDLEHISLEIGGHPRVPEVILAVRSRDPAAGRAIFARLSDEIERGVPWWGRGPVQLRIILGIVFLTAVISCATGLQLSPMYSISFDWSNVPLSAAMATFLTVVAISRPAVGVGSWFFPQFEVSGDGVSTASRRIFGLLGLLVTIPIGVFVNYIS